MNLLNVLLLMPQGGENAGGSGWMSFVFILLIIFVFYFFLIRPQSKQAKKERDFRESLQKGDKVITTGGIHGKIVEVNETTVILETEGQGRLKLEKAAIARQAEAQGK
ncbi:MAG: preprotein translocase subunit YajC [Bacteroidales bacterium]|jgi:preprotein translocase subunit YajC|nr:preprotein translocase subunit YajC [Bacteroidales bacterium]